MWKAHVDLQYNIFHWGSTIPGISTLCKIMNARDRCLGFSNPLIFGSRRRNHGTQDPLIFQRYTFIFTPNLGGSNLYQILLSCVLWDNQIGPWIEMIRFGLKLSFSYCVRRITYLLTWTWCVLNKKVNIKTIIAIQLQNNAD